MPDDPDAPYPDAPETPPPPVERETDDAPDDDES